MSQRSYLLFENACRRKTTLDRYAYHLEKFRNFTKIRDYDSLSNLDADAIQTLLENYIMHLKSIGIAGSSFKSYLNGIELFFECNRKNINKKLLHRLFPEIQKPGGEKPYSTEDIQKMLSCSTKKRTRAFIHFLASTGSRPSAIVDPVLKMKHISDMLLGCKSVIIYAGSREEYWGFLTPEASKALGLLPC